MDAEISQPMSQESAAAEATRRNWEAGARGEPDFYWIEAQGMDGQWRVERRGARKTWLQAGGEALRGGRSSRGFVYLDDRHRTEIHLSPP